MISYASSIQQPDTTFLDKVKIENENRNKKYDNIRSIVLTGTHSGDDQLSENDIKIIDEELTEVVNKSGVNHIKPSLNTNYQFLVPVDNKKQGKCKSTRKHTNLSSIIYEYMPEFIRNYIQMPVPSDSNKQAKSSQLPSINDDTKRYTVLSKISTFIKNLLDKQDKFYIPIKWLLLELEIRKVCQQNNCNLIAYNNVLKLAKERKLGYNGEFGIDVGIDSEQFIKQGLRFHHSFGVLLYFEDVEGMQKLVITNHQWLFNKLSKIVEYSFTCICDTVEEIKDLKNGIFKKTFISHDCLDIRRDFEDSQIDIKSVDPINAFLKLLEYLRIAAPLSKDAVKYFMPCLLNSCVLTDLKNIVPEYKDNDTEPLLIQFKSTDNKTYLFPRGIFCFLVVELMLTRKWEPHRKANVNALTLFETDTAHYITLLDRIFYLEIHVTHKKDGTIQDELRKIVTLALHTVTKKLKISCNLCQGFKCLCQGTEKIHISYLREDNDEFCCCSEKSPTYLNNCHKVWLKTYFKVCTTLFAVSYFLGLGQLIVFKTA